MIKETKTTDIVPTLSFEGKILRVTGRVVTPLVLSMADILAMETEEFQDLFIVCGTGEPREHHPAMQGRSIGKDYSEGRHSEGGTQ